MPPASVPRGFQVVDVSGWEFVAIEPTGTDEKAWLRDPHGGKALFKPNRRSNAYDQGEDWAEKLVSEVASLLGIPAAAINLAERSGVRGCVSYDVKPDDYELHSGELMLAQLPGSVYDAARTATQGHTLANIDKALRGIAPPPGSGFDGFDAFDLFVGYLVLDALTAGRDRHSENWAVLVEPRAGEPPRRVRRLRLLGRLESWQQARRSGIRLS